MRFIKTLLLTIALILAIHVSVPAVQNVWEFLHDIFSQEEILPSPEDLGPEDPGSSGGETKKAKSKPTNIDIDLGSFICTEGALYSNNTDLQYFGQTDTSYNTTTNYGDNWSKCFSASSTDGSGKTFKTVLLDGTDYTKIKFTYGLGYYFRNTDYHTKIEIRAGPEAKEGSLMSIYRSEDITKNSSPVTDEVALPEGTRVIQIVFESNCSEYSDLYIVTDGFLVERPMRDTDAA